MFFKIVYYIFAFSVNVLVLQTYGLPVTIRQLMSVIMFAACIASEKKLWMDKVFTIYLGFIIMFGVSCLFTGYVEEFILRLIGDYFVAYVAVWATFIMIKKYNATRGLIIFFLILGVFDGLVTIFQFFGLNYLDGFVNRFGLLSYDPYLQKQGTGEAMFSNCPPGVFSHPVLNAHVLLSCTVLSATSFKLYNKFVGLPLCVFMLIALFCTQQRAALLLGAFCYIILLSRGFFDSKYKLVYVLILAVAAYFVIPWFIDFLSSEEFRIVELGLESTGQTDIFVKGINFILNNPMGGLYDFYEKIGAMPHNLILGSFIFGGWIGGLFLLLVVFIQFKEAIKTLLSKESTFEIVVLSLVVLAMMGNGMMHNQSVVNGQITTWIMWSLFYYSKKKHWTLLLFII